MAQLPPTKDDVYKNNLAQIFQKMMKTRTPDFQFIFEGKDGEEAVKVSTHKDVLAAISPVFEAMFNGELKGKRDVKIVDASAAAFEEFLQFFYNDQVKLTMENIADVLNLAHKYDVTGCFQMAIEFLKENLDNENLVSGLELALKYESDDLKAFCKEKIKNNPKALDAFKTLYCDTSAKMRLSTNNLQCMLIEAFSIAIEVISEKSAEIDRLRSKCIFELFLSTCAVYTDTMISPDLEFTIRFSPNDYNNSLWLREIHFSNVYTKRGSSYQPGPLKGTVFITDGGRTIFEKQFGIDSKEEYVKLPKPILFSHHNWYRITIKPLVSGYASTAVENDSDVAFKNKSEFFNSSEFTLIDRLYFEELPKN